MNVAQKTNRRSRRRHGAQVPREAAEQTSMMQDWYTQYPEFCDAEAMAEIYRNRKAVSSIDFAQPPSLTPHSYLAPHMRPHSNTQSKSTPRSAITSIALLALLAIGGGGATGYLAAHPEVLGASQSAVVASSGTLDPSPFASLAAYAQQLFPGKDEATRGITASVRVKDVSGMANSTIPLGLDQNADPDAINYKISGVPEAVMLTAGIDLGSGNWIVKAKDIADLGLVADHKSGDLSLRVTALAEEDVLPTIPIKELTVTVTESAPAAVEPEKKTGKALAGLNKVEPMQAKGNPDVASESKEQLPRIIPAAAPPPNQFITE